MEALLLSLALLAQAPSLDAAPLSSPYAQVTQGSLHALRPGAGVIPCPLEHTEVRAGVAGPVVRVEVKQRFRNPFDEAIEAVYVFPLPEDASVDDMEIRYTDRIVRAEIRRREEARAEYERARDAGHVAALLEQERPNIFTQSVANIPPGGRVDITIRYIEALSQEKGRYEFVFPMTVGPRFIPGCTGSGISQATAGVKPAPPTQPPPGTGWAAAWSATSARTRIRRR